MNWPFVSRRKYQRQVDKLITIIEKEGVERREERERLWTDDMYLAEARLGRGLSLHFQDILLNGIRAEIKIADAFSKPPTV